jgi:mRNA interferase MazF
VKTISLKIDTLIFGETEMILSHLKIPRNRYINEALAHYNELKNRQLLEKQLQKESTLVQTNLLNNIPHPSTLICPLTTNVEKRAEILRVHLKKGMSNLNENWDIMIDQLRAIDNQRLVRKIGNLPISLEEKVKQNIKIVLDLV